MDWKLMAGLRWRHIEDASIPRVVEALQHLAGSPKDCQKLSLDEFDLVVAAGEQFLKLITNPDVAQRFMPTPGTTKAGARGCIGGLLATGCDGLAESLRCASTWAAASDRSEEILVRLLKWADECLSLAAGRLLPSPAVTASAVILLGVLHSSSLSKQACLALSSLSSPLAICQMLSCTVLLPICVRCLLSMLPLRRVLYLFSKMELHPERGGSQWPLYDCWIALALGCTAVALTSPPEALERCGWEIRSAWDSVSEPIQAVAAVAAGGFIRGARSRPPAATHLLLTALSDPAWLSNEHVPRGVAVGLAIAAPALASSHPRDQDCIDAAAEALCSLLMWECFRCWPNAFSVKEWSPLLPQADLLCIGMGRLCQRATPSCSHKCLDRLRVATGGLYAAVRAVTAGGGQIHSKFAPLSAFPKSLWDAVLSMVDVIAMDGDIAVRHASLLTSILSYIDPSSKAASGSSRQDVLSKVLMRAVASREAIRDVFILVRADDEELMSTNFCLGGDACIRDESQLNYAQFISSNLPSQSWKWDEDMVAAGRMLTFSHAIGQWLPLCDKDMQSHICESIVPFLLTCCCHTWRPLSSSAHSALWTLLSYRYILHGAPSSTATNAEMMNDSEQVRRTLARVYWREVLEGYPRSTDAHVLATALGILMVLAEASAEDQMVGLTCISLLRDALCDALRADPNLRGGTSRTLCTLMFGALKVAPLPVLSHIMSFVEEATVRHGRVSPTGQAILGQFLFNAIAHDCELSRRNELSDWYEKFRRKISGVS